MTLKNTLNFYKDLRPGNLGSHKYRHILLLLYWPIYAAVFFSLEHLWPSIWKAITGETLEFYEVVCDLDAYIPFCEWFAIPYYFWFAFIALMLGYGLLFDIQAFRQASWFIIFSYSITVVIYLLWPNMQSLRPTDFPRDNILVDWIKGLYDFDTNTNVCPSIHVLGSFAVFFAGWHSKTLKGRGWKVFFVISTALITLSTVFLKQHSVLDMLAAFVLCVPCYFLVYRWTCRPRPDDVVISEK